MAESAPLLSRQRQAYQKDLRRALEQVVATLSALPEVERISLFGSYARGRADLFTDLDILVVLRTREPFGERLRRLYALLAVPVDMDLLCYTPDELEALKGSPFFRRLLSEEVVLYEKKSQ